MWVISFVILKNRLLELSGRFFWCLVIGEDVLGI